MGAFPFRELGTTVDFVINKRKRSAETLKAALEKYYDECQKECYSTKYLNKIQALISQLEEGV
jgi:hypothetical protein